MGNNTSVHPVESINDEQINTAHKNYKKGHYSSGTLNLISSSCLKTKPGRKNALLSTTSQDFDDFPGKASEIKLLIMKSNSATVLSSKLQDCFSRVSSCQLSNSRSSLTQLQEMCDTMMTCTDVVVQIRDQFSVTLSLLRTMNGVYSIINNILVYECEQNDGSAHNYEEIQKKWSSWSLWSSNFSRKIGKSAFLSNRSDTGSGTETTVSVSVLLLESSKLEVMSLAFPNPAMKGEAVRATVNVVVGAVSSVLKMSPDARLISGLLSSASLAIKVVRRRQAAFIVDIFSMFDSLVAFSYETLKRPFSLQDAKDMTTEKFVASFSVERKDNNVSKSQSRVESIRESIMSFQEVFVNDLHSSMKRWEVLAAFAVMLTDIYLCVSGRMKTLVYEYCLSALLEQHVLVVVNGREVRVNNVSSGTGKEKEAAPEEKQGGETNQLYTHAMDVELQRACHAITNSWMFNLQQQQQQQEEEIHSGGVSNVKASFLTESIKIPSEIRSEFAAMSNLCSFIWQGLWEEKQVFHYSLSALLEYGDSRGVNDIDMGSMMVSIAEWTEDLRDFLFSDNSTVKMDDWLQRGMNMICDEGSRVLERAKAEGEKGMKDLENTFTKLVADLEVSVVNDFGKVLSGGQRRLRVDEVNVVHILSTTITQFVALSSKAQTFANFSGGKLKKVVSYISTIDSVLTKIIPSDALKLLNSEYLKVQVFLQSLKQISISVVEMEVDRVLQNTTDAVITRYLKAAELLKSHYTALRPLLDAANFIVSVFPASSLSISIQVGDQFVSTQDILDGLSSCGDQATDFISAFLSELQQYSEQDGESTCRAALDSLKDKLSKLMVQSGPAQQLISYKDLILAVVSSYEQKLSTSAFEKDAGRYQHLVGTFFAEMMLVLDKMRTVQSVLATAQAKCEDLSEAIGKSISGLQVFKSKLDLIAKSNWRGKESFDWGNMVKSLKSSFAIVLDDYKESSTMLSMSAMSLLSFLQQSSTVPSTSIGDSSMIRSGANDVLSSAVTVGMEQLKNSLKGNVEGINEQLQSSVQNEFNGLKKNFQFILVGLRDAAVTELEEKSAECLDAFTAIADSAKATFNSFLDFDSIESGSEGLLASVGGLVKDFVKGVVARPQHWRVRDVSAFCVLRMVSGAAHEVHAAALRKTIAKRKVRKRRSFLEFDYILVILYSM